MVIPGAEKRRPVFAAYAKGGRRLHVGLQEFGEDVSAAMSAGAAKASNALFSGISSLKLGASFVANAVTIKRVDPRETEGEALILIPKDPSLLPPEWPSEPKLFCAFTSAAVYLPAPQATLMPACYALPKGYSGHCYSGHCYSRQCHSSSAKRCE